MEEKKQRCKCAAVALILWPEKGQMFACLEHCALVRRLARILDMGEVALFLSPEKLEEGVVCEFDERTVDG